MTVTYIKWRDATHSIDEWDIKDMALSELSEVGFLLGENADSVSIAMEHQGDGSTTRLWLCIPKVNIVDRRDMEVDRAFPARRRRKV